MNVATIITDGSADNRNGSGGWAALIRTSTALVECTGHAHGTTSNRMELLAAIEGLKYLSAPTTVTLISDSAYVIRTLKNKWYLRWFEEERLGTRSIPRPNMDLWYQLVGLINYHTVEFVKVKGHSGDYWNERADQLAEFARRNKSDDTHIIDGWRPGIRCILRSASERQCKLHIGHSGNCHWSSIHASVYGTERDGLQNLGHQSMSIDELADKV